MDDVFRALADPTRRRLLDELFREDGQTLSALEGRLPMTRFGVMKHLKQLEEAGLAVTRRRSSALKAAYSTMLPCRSRGPAGRFVRASRKSAPWSPSGVTSQRPSPSRVLRELHLRRHRVCVELSPSVPEALARPLLVHFVSRDRDFPRHLARGCDGAKLGAAAPLAFAHEDAIAR